MFERNDLGSLKKQGKAGSKERPKFDAKASREQARQQAMASKKAREAAVLAKKQAENAAKEKAKQRIIEAKKAREAAALAKRQFDKAAMEKAKQRAIEAKKAREAVAMARKQAEKAAAEKAKQQASAAKKARETALLAKRQAAKAVVEKAKQQAAEVKKVREAALLMKKQAEKAAAEKAKQQAIETKKAREAVLLAKKEAEKAVAEKTKQQAIAAKKAREAALLMKKQAEKAAAVKTKQLTIEARKAQEAALLAKKEIEKSAALAKKEAEKLAADKAKQEALEARKAQEATLLAKKQAEKLAADKAKHEIEAKKTQEATLLAKKEAEKVAAEKAKQEIEAKKAQEATLLAKKEAEKAAAEKAKQEIEAKKAQEATLLAKKQAEKLAADKAKQEALAARKAQEATLLAKKEAEKAAAEKAKHEIEAKKAQEATLLAKKEAEKLAAEKAKQEALEARKVQEAVLLAKKEAEKVAAEKTKQEIEAKKAQEAILLAKKEAEKLAADKAKQEALAAWKAQEAALLAKKEAEKLAAEKAKQQAIEAKKVQEMALLAKKEAEKLAAEKAKQEALEAKKAQEAVLLAKKEAEKAAKEKAKQEALEAKKAQAALLAQKKTGKTVGTMVPLFSRRSLLILCTGVIVGSLLGLGYWIVSPSLHSTSSAAGGQTQLSGLTKLVTGTTTSGPHVSNVNIQIVNPGSSFINVSTLQSMGEYYAAKANSLPFYQFLSQELTEQAPIYSHTADKLGQMITFKVNWNSQTPVVQMMVTGSNTEEALFLATFAPDSFKRYLAAEENAKQQQEYQNTLKQIDTIKVAVLEAEKKADALAPPDSVISLNNNPTYIALNAKIQALEGALNTQASKLANEIVTGDVATDPRTVQQEYQETLQQAKSISAALSQAEQELHTLELPSSSSDNATYVMLEARVNGLELALDRLINGYTEITGDYSIHVDGLVDLVAGGISSDAASYTDLSNKIYTTSSDLAAARKDLAEFNAQSSNNTTSDVNYQLAKNKVSALNAEMSVLVDKLTALDRNMAGGGTLQNAQTQTAFDRTSVALAEAKKQLDALQNQPTNYTLPDTLDYQLAKDKVNDLNKLLATVSSQANSMIGGNTAPPESVNYLVAGNPSLPTPVLPERMRARNALMMGAIVGIGLAWAALNFRWLTKGMPSSNKATPKEDEEA